MAASCWRRRRKRERVEVAVNLLGSGARSRLTEPKRTEKVMDEKRIVDGF